MQIPDSIGYTNLRKGRDADMKPQTIKQKSKWGKFAKIITITIVSFIAIAMFVMWQTVVGFQDLLLDLGF